MIRPEYSTPCLLLDAVDRATLVSLLRDYGEARASERYIKERLLLNWIDTRWPSVIATLEAPTETP